MKIHVFGKPDCPKCRVLNGMIDLALQDKKYSNFKKVYHNLMEYKDLAKFCLVGQLNPTKMPVFIISYDDDEFLECMPNYDLPEWRIFSRYGCQTDWSKYGMNGNISYKQVVSEIDRACV